jgi:hypothetical protein
MKGVNSESLPEHYLPCSVENFNKPVSDRIQNWYPFLTTAFYVRTIINVLKTTKVRISRTEDSTIQRLQRGPKIIDFKRAYVYGQRLYTLNNE